MTNDGPSPTHHARQMRRRREVFHLAGSAAVVVFAAGYMVADFESGRLYGLVRSIAAVAAVALLLWLQEVRMQRRLSQMQACLERMLDERLERQRQWKAYADVLSDLSGLSGEDSGDISTNRRG